MNEQCPLISDRMPDVLAGRDRWTEEDRAHLAECSECGTEWLLVKQASTLGNRAAGELDHQEVARQVLLRLGSFEGSSGRRMVRWAMAVAAALLIAALGWAGFSGRSAPAEQAAEFLPQLDSLDAGELSVVFRSLDDPAADQTPQLLPGETAGLTDLTDSELQLILDSWEG